MALTATARPYPYTPDRPRGLVCTGVARLQRREGANREGVRTMRVLRDLVSDIEYLDDPLAGEDDLSNRSINDED